MKTYPFREFVTQSVFAVLQAALIIGGSLTTAAIMKARGYPDPAQFWHPWAIFIRNWGFILILIPSIWVVTTIYLERHRGSDFSLRWTMISGVFVFVGIGLIMGISVILGSGSGSLIQSINQ